jgi:UPF0042 nucleotide-binding protein
VARVSEFVVVAGLSGAGRSSAADVLEDAGWFVIDNLPALLIPKVTELASAPGSAIERIALVAGTGQHQGDVAQAVEEMRRAGDRVRVLFLDASDDTLVRRYESSRRRHPLGANETVKEAITRERELLEPVKAMADVIVDTSDLNIHQLRDRIVALFSADRPDAGLQTHVVSFGFKHGVPTDVDLVLDCRFLPNPHWVEELRPLTGLDDSVREYVLAQPATAEFLARLENLLELLLPGYVTEGKSYLSIALGCTGGRHRSVVIAEEVAGILRKHGFDPTVTHRDLDR